MRGLFFYLKYEIPAIEDTFVKLIFFIFFLDIPPKATTFLFVYLIKILNLLKPKKFLFLLNSDDIKMFWTFCNSLILISLRLWADPTTAKFRKVEYAKWLKLLLKEGI